MNESILPLKIRDLRKSFRTDSMLRSVEVLRGVDLTVHPGEVFGFLGPNGAGKTTTIKVVMGLIHATSGEIHLFGEPAGPPATRARVGFLPEHPYFYDYLTVEEILKLVAELHGLTGGVRRERVGRVMERLRLTDRRKTALRKLSKGWMQRVGMAQALINDPDLLILDEPLSGLDPIGRRELRELVRELADEGKTICLSSHILSDAEMLCDRVAVIVDGKIRHEGRLDAYDPATVRGVEIVLASIDASGLEGAPTAPSSIQARDEQLLVHVADPDAVSGFLAHAIARGATVVSVTPRRAGLEDIFNEAVAAGREQAA